MKFYMAPLEGITGYIYRNTFDKYFGDVDKYFTPFITPNQNVLLNRKEKKDVLPENNICKKVIPQIMTNNAEYFTGLQKELLELGYDEVNLNLGCPAATVVTKNKGAGMLIDTDKLDDFLYSIFENNCSKISLKTRIGMYSSEEFDVLLEIFNKYQMEELIIHPRVRESYYKDKVDLETFSKALNNSKNKLVYNGDIHSVEAYDSFVKQFEDIDTIMLGRGLLKNPALIKNCLGNTENFDKLIMEFMKAIQKEYYDYMKDERNVLFKLKELWLYLHEYYDDGDKYWKKINKAKNFAEYDAIILNMKSRGK